MLRLFSKSSATLTNRRPARRVGLFFVMLLMVASTATSLITPQFTHNAAAQSANDTALGTLYNRTKSYAYLNALRWCIKESQGHLIDNTLAARRDRISIDDVISGTWFQSNTAFDWILGEPYRTAPSYLSEYTDTDTDTDRGMAMCNSVVGEVIGPQGLWGYADGLELMCDFVPFRADGESSCENGSDQNFGPIHDYADEFYEAIKARIYGGETPSLYETLKDGTQGHPGRYLLYKEAFERGCSPREVSSAADNRFYENVKIVADDGTYTELDYEGIARGDERSVYIDRDNLAWQNIACGTIAERVNDYADIYIKYRKLSPEEPAKGSPLTPCVGTDCVSDGESSCAIDGIGWIICPVVNFLAGIADGAFGFLADSFLRTDPQVFNTQGAAYQAWSVMRTIANIAFVIVFLIIIMSQLTSVGISNYGVKKMLPRLVVAAILVNVSFFISQLAIDISNILGYSVKDVFESITQLTIGGENAQAAINNQSPFATGEGFAGVAGAILTGTAVGIALYALLSTFIPILLAAVVALIMIMFILVFRQAVIILLVVISPLAFVAYLLPNTESLFTKWRQALTAMLLLFPIIALVFGASTLASQILSTTFNGGLQGDTDNWFGQITAAAVMILPLFVVPTLLQKSLDGIPVLGKFASNLSSRANANLGKKIGESYRGSLFARGRAIRKKAREDYRTRRFAQRVQKGGAASLVAQGLSAPGITKLQEAEKAALTNTVGAIMASQESEELKEAIQALTRKLSAHKASGGDPDEFFEHMAKNGATAAERSAAMHLAAANGRDGVIRRLAGSTTGEERESLQRAIDANTASLKGKAPDIVKGTAAAFSSFTGADMAQWSGGTANEFMDHLAALHASGDTQGLTQAINMFNSAAADIAGSAELQGTFSADAGSAILAKLGQSATSNPALHAYLQNHLGGAAGINPEGKIR